jgi:ABC-type transport system substrate-binding protein
MSDPKSDASSEALPPALSQGAIVRDGEYAWELIAFPAALQKAPDLGYACLGGQFWFFLSDGSLYEPFWLEANSGERGANETWPDYKSRSCSEVAKAFEALAKETDFEKEAAQFKSLQGPFSILFNAYFVTEAELVRLGLQR